MVENLYKNDNSDGVLKKIINKLIEYDQSLRKIKSYLKSINLFLEGEAFARDFNFLEKEMLKVEDLWNIHIEAKADKSKRNLFSKIIYFLKNIYIKLLFFFLKPFRNRLIANNLAFMNALKYLVNSHKKLISDTDKLYRIIKELLVEMNKSIVDISEQQDYILNMIVDDKKKEKQGIN